MGCSALLGTFGWIGRDWERAGCARGYGFNDS